jgi:hypothetical protein
MLVVAFERDSFMHSHLPRRAARRTTVADHVDGQDKESQ